MIKSYRGLIAEGGSGGSTKINIHTNNGKTGYEVKKFQAIQKSPGAKNCEGLVIIYKVPPTAAQIAATTIDLTDNTIVGVCYYSSNAASDANPEDLTIIFDSEKFNQDIYVTYRDVSGVNDSMNYYIELEQVSLSDDQALIAIVKNLRNEQ